MLVADPDTAFKERTALPSAIRATLSFFARMVSETGTSTHDIAPAQIATTRAMERRIYSGESTSIRNEDSTFQSSRLVHLRAQGGITMAFHRQRVIQFWVKTPRPPSPEVNIDSLTHAFSKRDRIGLI